MKRILVMLAVLVIFGCGQSGPLYIPGDPSRIEHRLQGDSDSLCQIQITVRSRRWTRSNVVHRAPQSGQARRRRIAVLSSVGRESFT